jgi:ubiquinone/menaquinone biosynthesis C-methylase UbiE
MDNNFWDNNFYKSVSDKLPHSQTIYKCCPEEKAFFHYQTTSNIIYYILLKYRIILNKNEKILDIGSGSGYWIDMYKNLYETIKINSTDISVKVYNVLKNKYKNNNNITVYNDNILDHNENNYNLINAIGVMFHIVDDNDFELAIEKISNILLKDGYFIVGGEFGNENKYLNFINNEKPIKQIRSYDYWKNILNKYNLKIINKFENKCRKFIATPQNNILLIQKQ